MNLRMIDPNLFSIATAINRGVIGRPMGELQKRRAFRKGISRTPRLFDRRAIWDKWAFHVGGQQELQFNIGFEEENGDETRFRHGVAFSLQPNQNVPDISIFRERIQRFNDYLEDHPKAFNDLLMWYFSHDGRSSNFAPTPIPESLVRPHVFIVLGTICPAHAIDIETILDDFDRLMPLYEFVEEATEPPVQKSRTECKFKWTPGNRARVLRTRFERPEPIVEAVLRHNALQAALFSHLCDLHSAEHVSGEQDNGTGKFVDVAVRDGDNYIYYEIKTSLSPQCCIREAFGQLMEYSYWPGAQQAAAMVIVGESPLDSKAEEYLRFLNIKFSLPLTYRQFDLEKCRLLP